MSVSPAPQVASFFDPDTGTWTHVVYDHDGGHAAVVDPVLDYDPHSGRTRDLQARQVIAFVRAHDLTVDWILETHAHADHLSAAPLIRDTLGGQIAIGARICDVQGIFKARFHLEDSFATDGSQFDRLFQEGDTFQIGSLQAQAWHVPGHTPADMAYVVGDAVFVGDTLFQPDTGTARCDFPGGDARALYHSIQRLLRLPGQTRLFICHDYPPTARAPQPVCTVDAQRAGNIHVRDGIAETEFVAMRQARDQGLALPRLILPSVQVNIRAGRLPPAEADGQHYLKIPVNVF
jgi:glyoxylase-like metal-dependent hydrolase (beta-lactamase superfamily II)